VLPVEMLVDWPTTPTGQLATDGKTLLLAVQIQLLGRWLHTLASSQKPILD